MNNGENGKKQVEGSGRVNMPLLKLSSDNVNMFVIKNHTHAHTSTPVLVYWGISKFITSYAVFATGSAIIKKLL